MGMSVCACVCLCVVVAIARRRTRNWRLFFSLCVLVFGLYAITNSTYAHALVMHDQLNVKGGGEVCVVGEVSWVRAERVCQGELA